MTTRKARLEAMVGLARRRDRRVLPIVLAELEREDSAKTAIEAAGWLAMPELVASLRSVRTWTTMPALIDIAIARCEGHNEADQDWGAVILSQQA